MNTAKRLLTSLLLALGLIAQAAEVIPPAPKQYFNDYANVVSAGPRQQLNQRLEQFERDTSSQIVVAVFPKMQSDSSIEDYTVRVAQSWKVGQKDKNNGAVLFVFINDRKMYLQVGYGLEGALPDALCKRIIEDEIKPHFKEGDYKSGLEAGVTAILAAAKGEYKGPGRIVIEQVNGRSSDSSTINLDPLLSLVCIGGVCLLIFTIAIFSFIRSVRQRGWLYTITGWGSSSGSSWGGGGWSSGGGGGGWSSGGGGGGFSGGGGSFGGGGAGGSW